MILNAFSVSLVKFIVYTSLLIGSIPHSERGEKLNKEKRIESFQRVENLVKKKGTTLYAVAKELGLARSLFSDWKSGKSMPKTDKLIKIANYFGVTVDYIIGS